MPVLLTKHNDHTWRSSSSTCEGGKTAEIVHPYYVKTKNGIQYFRLEKVLSPLQVVKENKAPIPSYKGCAEKIINGKCTTDDVG